MRRAAAVLVVIALAGCAPRRMPPPKVPLVRSPAYLDLEAGWSVHVVTPVLKSGGFLLRPQEERAEGNTITMRADDEVLGYETAVYGVKQGRRGGVRLALSQVTLHRGDTLTRPRKSIAPGLGMPGRMRYVRLLYMQKVSDADHNMAILAATDTARLQALTQRVQATPLAGCRDSRHEYCAWVPAGVAVRAERPR